MFQLLLLLRLLLFVSLFTLGAHGYALPTDSSTYRNCPSYDCGNGVTISYPFWEKSNVSAGDRYCGYEGFGLNCSAATREPILLLPQNSYYVKNISYSSTTGTVTLVDIDVIGQNCPRARHNLSLETVPLYHTKSELNLTFYFNCSVLAPPPGGAYVECLRTYTTYQGQVKKSFVIETVNEVESYYWWNNCDDKVVVTVMENEIDLANLTGDFGQAMNSGFALDWGSQAQCARCEVTGGRCGGFNAANNSTNLCLCPDGKITADVCSGIGTGVSHFPVHDMIEARSSKLQSLHPLLFFFFFINMVRLRLLSSSIPAILFLILATASTPLSQSSAATDANFTTYSASFHCGNLPQPLRYPFWGDSRPEYCGDPAFRLDCPPESYPTISILDSAFQVLDINGSDYTMRISGMNLSSSCPEKFNSIELDDKHFLIAPGLSTMLTIFSGCPPELARQHPYYYFECGGLPGENNGTFYFGKSEFLGFSSDDQHSLRNSCSHNVDVPINNQIFGKLMANETQLYEDINKGFVVRYSTEVAENCSAFIWY